MWTDKNALHVVCYEPHKLVHGIASSKTRAMDSITGLGMLDRKVENIYVARVQFELSATYMELLSTIHEFALNGYYIAEQNQTKTVLATSHCHRLIG